MEKQRIAIDMDEVLADVIAKFEVLYKQNHPEEALRQQQDGEEFYAILPEHIAGDFRKHIYEKGFFRDLEVIKDSQRVVKELDKKYDVFIVSAAMEFRNSLEDKVDWLADHFPFISWQRTIFCGLKIVNVDVMIDDRSRNFTAFDGRPLLFTSPHNKLITEFERVDTWEDIAAKLL
ncbi:MAG: 5' nucleotidase, NT5C type [Janthinobacterium lividum]